VTGRIPIKRITLALIAKVKRHNNIARIDQGLAIAGCCPVIPSVLGKKQHKSDGIREFGIDERTMQCQAIGSPKSDWDSRGDRFCGDHIEGRRLFEVITDSGDQKASDYNRVGDESDEQEGDKDGECHWSNLQGVLQQYESIQGMGATPKCGGAWREIHRRMAAELPFEL